MTSIIKNCNLLVLNCHTRQWTQVGIHAAEYLAIIKIKNKIFFKYFQVEVQTEHIIEEEKWTQKPPNLTITSDLEDSDLIRENLLGCGGGKQVSWENGGFTGATPPPLTRKTWADVCLLHPHPSSYGNSSTLFYSS